VKRRAFVVALSAAAAATPRALRAEVIAPMDAIARLFTAPSLREAWFTPLFLASVPLDQVRTIIANVADTLGPYASIVPNGSAYTVAFARGTIQANASLDASGAFSGLLFSRMQSAAAHDRLAAIFGPDPVPAAWFSSRFLSAVPLERSHRIIDALKAQYGAFRGVTPAADGTYTLAFAGGRLTALIYLGPDGKIEGLIFRPLGAAAEPAGATKPA
jgi:hypothetical protein